MIVKCMNDIQSDSNSCNANLQKNHYYNISIYTECNLVSCQGHTHSQHKERIGILLKDVQTGRLQHITNFLFRAFLRQNKLKIISNLKEE